MFLLYASLAYLVGIAIGRLLWDAAGAGCPWPGWLWLAPAALLPLTPLLNRLRPRAGPPTPLRWPISAGFEPLARGIAPGVWVALVLCALTGALRYTGQPYIPCWTPTDLAYYNLASDRAFDRRAPQATLLGYVSSYPLLADTQQELVVTATQIVIDGVPQPVTGSARLKTGMRQRLAYGQPLQVTGRLVAPPVMEDFNYQEYLARKGIHSLLYNVRLKLEDGPLQGSPLLRALYAVRARGETFLNQALPEPYAGLANGMLLGIEAGIPDDLYDQFNATGTSHVIVISGSNVALVSGVIVALAARLLGRRRAAWPALAGIACYALLVGGDAAVLRASVMGGLAVVAIALNRRSTALVSLAVACACMTLINPLALWDVGLQLSSSATAGLMLLVPSLTRAFDRLLPARVQNPVLRGLHAFLADALLVTLAANITTLPLVVYYFGRLSVISLLCNMLIGPFQSVIMFGGSLGVILGVVGLPWVGKIVLWLPWLALAWTVAMVQWTASLPFASLTIAGYGPSALIATYALIFGLRWRRTLQRAGEKLLGWLRRDWVARLATPGVASILTVTTALLWAGALTQPDGRLHVWFLDIGQGDGILLQTPSGRQVLIDGGASPQALFAELGAVMPFWDRSLDLVVLTHPDGDHMIAQVETPTRFQIAAAWNTAAGQAHPDAAAWRTQLAAGGAAMQVQHSGGWADLGDGVALWVLSPPAAGYTGDDADNDNSLVTKLVYGDFSVLLTGDGGIPVERDLVADVAPLRSVVLKAGHHGSRSGSSEAFVEAVDPPVVVIQVGKDNDYGHPHAEVLARLEGRLVLRNDEDGRVHVASDGWQMWIET